jgi:acyl carrier protein
MNRDAIVEDLCEIMSDLLKVPVLEGDNLRALGADSIATMRMVAAADKRFGIKIPLSSAFMARTVGEFADSIGQAISRMDSV